MLAIEKLVSKIEKKIMVYRIIKLCKLFQRCNISVHGCIIILCCNNIFYRFKIISDNFLN